MRKIGAATGGKTAKAPGAGYDVFLIAGQSNALGAGLGFDARLDRPHEMVHQFAGSGRKAGRTLVGEHPLWHHTRASGVGFGPMFGRLHIETTGRPVLLVPAARGESGFHPQNGSSWDVEDQPGTVNLFTFACQQVSTALATHPGSELRGILWHQGETDARHAPEVYAEKLDALISGFRDEFGQVPFILGQMSPDRMAEAAEEVPGYQVVDAAHRDTPNRVPAASFVEAPAGMYNSPGDKLHFNAAGQRELGRRYYQAYRRVTAVQAW